MSVLIKMLIVTGFVIVGAIGFAYSGLYDVSAKSSHSYLVSWLLSTTAHASIERYASGIRTPDLDSPILVRVGVSDFDAMCAGCHGAPGKKPDAVGQGLNPQAPDLAESATHMSSAEIFWVTKHGIRMTGMPAWGVTHDDVALWPVVAFLQRLPELDADEYEALLASAADVGHHASEVDVEIHGHGSATAPASAGSGIHSDSGPAIATTGRLDESSEPSADRTARSAHDNGTDAANQEVTLHESGHDHGH